MKRFLSILLVLCFTSNVFAASTANLERAMDEYRFALTVDWDQKDQAVYKAKTDAFFNEMANLIAQDGLSKDEILAVAEKKMKNKAQFEALKLKLSLVGKVQSSKELATFLQESAKDMYAQGASWNGTTVQTVVVGVLLLAVIGYAIWFEATHQCVRYEQRDYLTCEEEYRTVCGLVGDCFQAYQGTNCEYKSYCVEHQKKN